MRDHVSMRSLALHFLFVECAAFPSEFSQAFTQRSALALSVMEAAAATPAARAVSISPLAKSGGGRGRGSIDTGERTGSSRARSLSTTAAAPEPGQSSQLATLSNVLSTASSEDISLAKAPILGEDLLTVVDDDGDTALSVRRRTRALAPRSLRPCTLPQPVRELLLLTGAVCAPAAVGAIGRRSRSCRTRWPASPTRWKQSSRE